MEFKKKNFIGDSRQRSVSFEKRKLKTGRSIYRQDIAKYVLRNVLFLPVFENFNFKIRTWLDFEIEYRLQAHEYQVL